ncbi:MAG: AAA-like domain-containing protein [Cyanobacteria bacterium P01_F01_bin.86]
MPVTQPTSSLYQVGGSLAPHASCYVERQADTKLFTALNRGEFCYVLNSRQMGKSSLRVRTTHRLQAQGIRCGVIDLTEIGTRNLAPDQWYASITLCLVNSFNLSVNLGEWWRERLYLSPVKRLAEFVDCVLLSQIQDDIVLFIDEIDSVLSLGFSVEDFFALIRAWYNRRTESSTYRRFTLALFGVAAPSELITDCQHTPFNIGKAIALDGFKLQEAHPLLPGLASICDNPEAMLTQILDWTGGQPFLTQKLCQLVLDIEGKTSPGEAIWRGEAIEEWPIHTSLSPRDIDRLVQTRILNNWEAQDEPEHLKTIRDYLLKNECQAGRLLGLYQTILKQGAVTFEDRPESRELLLSGVVVKSGNVLTLRNRIYGTVFDNNWVSYQFSKLRPYANALTVWLASDCRDESRLLRGQALQEAQVWSSLHSLSDEDYQYLTASQTLEQREIQQRLQAQRTQAVEAQLAAEAERAQEAEARLVAETASARRKRWLLTVASVGFLVASILGLTTFFQYQQAVENQRQAKLREIEAIATSSEALFASNQTLDATIKAIQVMRQLQEVTDADSELQFQVAQALRQAIYYGVESNRLSGHQTGIEDVAIHPDGQLIASASADSTIKLWQTDGTLLRTFTENNHIVLSVTFSPDGQLIASGGYDKTVRIWKLDGTLVSTMEGHDDDVTTVVFSPDSQQVASASVDSTIKLWNIDGTLTKTIKGNHHPVRKLTFSPDGQYLASLGDDKLIKLWRSDGSLIRTIEENGAGIHSLSFSPDSQLIASSSLDNVKLWNLDGRVLRTLEGGGKQLAFSPDGKVIAAVSDAGIRFWTPEGTPLPQLRTPLNHSIARIMFSPDGQFLVSASRDRTVRLWQMRDTLLTSLEHPFWTRDIAFSPDGKKIAAAGWDHTVRLWQANGDLLHIFRGHQGIKEYEGRVNGVSFSPNGQLIASSGADGTIKFWKSDGTLLKTLKIGDQGAQVYDATFSPDSQMLLSVAWGGPIQLWTAEGTLVKTLEGSDKNGGRGDFSPDGQLIAAPVGIHNTIKLWQRDGTLLQTMRGHQAWVTQVLFAPDGEHLVSTGADQTIRIWKLDGTLVRTIEAHEDAIIAIAISPDGQLIASGGRDAVVKLWRWDGTLAATFPQSNMIWGIAFHPDGNQLAWTGLNHITRLHDLDLALNPDHLLHYACDWVRNYLRISTEVAESDRQLCNDITEVN